MANKVLTTARLSKELQDALQADAKRQVTMSVRQVIRPQPGAALYLPLCCLQAIDSAKKRAVGQHVDYETFKNMVCDFMKQRPAKGCESIYALRRCLLHTSDRCKTPRRPLRVSLFCTLSCL